MKQRKTSDLGFGCLVVILMGAFIWVCLHHKWRMNRSPEAGGRSDHTRRPTTRPVPRYFPDDPIALEEFVEVVALRQLMDAVEQVESGGDCKAVGDGGKSRGPMQCGRLAWLDALEFAGIDPNDSGWNYDKWVRDLAKSRQIFMWYTTRWKAVSHEERARCWNSGPKWREKYHLTDGYWRKVQGAMK